MSCVPYDGVSAYTLPESPTHCVRVLETPTGRTLLSPLLQSISITNRQSACLCVYACARVCVCACACARVCLCECVCVCSLTHSLKNCRPMHHVRAAKVHHVMLSLRWHMSLTARPGQHLPEFQRLAQIRHTAGSVWQDRTFLTDGSGTADSVWKMRQHASASSESVQALWRLGVSH